MLKSVINPGVYWRHYISSITKDNFSSEVYEDEHNEFSFEFAFALPQLMLAVFYVCVYVDAYVTAFLCF